MALAERLQSDTSAFLKNTRNWVNKKCALQRRTIQNELWLMMVMMVGLMMMKMSWIKIEGLKVWGRNNATGVTWKTFLHWLTEHKTLSGPDSWTRHGARVLFTQLLTSFPSSRDKPWPLCMKWDLLRVDSHADAKRMGERCFRRWTTFSGKCSWKEHSPWHLVKETSKVRLLTPLVKKPNETLSGAKEETRAANAPTDLHPIHANFRFLTRRCCL